VIRIVGIQRSQSAAQEFVLLQNQGSMRLSLRGHMVVSDNAIDASDLTQLAHAFNDDVLIPPGMYVLLFSGRGTPKWARTKDGALVYYAYMHRDYAVWDQCNGPIHVLNTHHSFVDRTPNLVMS